MTKLLLTSDEITAMYDEVTDVPASNDVESEPLYQASVWLWKIGFPVILAAGTFGNVMVIVMHRRLAATQDSSISVYFTALAVSDLLSLWFDPVFWCLQAFGFTVVNDGVCKVRVFLAYLTGHTSAAILVAMTFQRAASILWPHRVNDMCNHGTARVVTCLVYLLLVVLNAHILFGHRMEPTDTQPEAVCFYGYVASDYEIFFRHVWGWIDTLLCAILPFFLLLASNAVPHPQSGPVATKSSKQALRRQCRPIRFSRKGGGFHDDHLDQHLRGVLRAGPPGVRLPDAGGDLLARRGRGRQREGSQ
ncbi:hypothetical protein C0Q70_21484 [Pomacea canaliculata]|uniref:G-protein coupled receptors family 1 profile domain-containing protein n=1 Tax=Pomacea canaliculata TaxID=400727 RepID=A0A2T7NCP2_POMCA|nr:hypothetical protein C0Q70_21484 [Pomacea canaliculata]